LSNKASLVPHNLTILPLFVFKDPFGSYDIHISLEINYGRNLVSLKILLLFMHGTDPTRIRKSVPNISRLKEGNKECIRKAGEMS
jgi:hypothetical protein